VSASLDSARPGEVLLLDDQGRVMGPRAMRRAQVVNWGAAGGMVGIGSAVLAALTGPVFGVAVGVSAMGLLLWHARRASELKRVLTLASAGRRDEALAAVSALEARRPGDRLLPPFIDYLTGKLEWQRGNFDVALRRYDRARGALTDPRRRHGRGMYWLCTFDRVQLLAAMGNVTAARTARAELEGAPHGDYFEMELALSDLMIGFHADDAGLLPEDDELYEWAKAALRTSRFGASVVLLAWAFTRRGDTDMARHLLREAPPRLAHEFLADSAPKVHAWLTEALATTPPPDDLDILDESP
jgi:hypothetical protein